MDKLKIKETLKELILAEIDNRLEEERSMIESCREAANSDTKSSAGDKYETNRAMMHLEQEKYSKQLSDTLELRRIMSEVPVDKINDKVLTGSVVETSIGTFFLAVSADEIEIHDEEYTPISLASPIGDALKGALIGSSVPFRGKEIKIHSLF